MSRVDDYIEDRLGGNTSTSNENIAVDCPNCGREKHFSIHREKAVGHCWVCGYAVNLTTLIQDLEGLPKWKAQLKSKRLLSGRGRSSSESDISEADSSVLSLLSELLYADVAENRRANPEASTLSLPPRCVPLSHPHARQAVRYLAGRGFTEAHWSRYGLLYCLGDPGARTPERRHIVFPEYDDRGTLVYYTTRAAYEPADGIPKSIHPKAPKRGILYGLGALPHRGIGVLVEGPLDALALRGHGVALLGKYASDEQVRLLAERCAKVLVCLDRGEEGTSALIADRIQRFGGNAFVTRLPSRFKDPGEMCRMRHPLIALIRNASPSTLESALAARLHAL